MTDSHEHEHDLCHAFVGGSGGETPKVDRETEVRFWVTPDDREQRLRLSRAMNYKTWQIELPAVR